MKPRISQVALRAGGIVMAGALSLALAACGNSTTAEGELTETGSASMSATKTTNKEKKRPAPTRSNAGNNSGAQPASQQDGAQATPTPTPAGQDAGYGTGQGAAPVIGHTEEPGKVTPSVMNKTISHCGSLSLHQLGTTFFTDGTSGWTETCHAQMLEEMRVAGTYDMSVYE